MALIEASRIFIALDRKPRIVSTARPSLTRRMARVAWVASCDAPLGCSFSCAIGRLACYGTQPHRASGGICNHEHTRWS